MQVTCSRCGQTTELAPSNDDRANWEEVVERRVQVAPTIVDYDRQGNPIIQPVSRPVPVVVARRLVWKCPQRVEDNDLDCDETNEIIEPVEETVVEEG